MYIKIRDLYDFFVLSPIVPQGVLQLLMIPIDARFTYDSCITDVTTGTGNLIGRFVVSFVCMY